MHQPQFSFHDQAIYDGDIKVADFQPVQLVNLRLSPQGPELFHALQLQWRFYMPNELYTSEIEELKVEGEGTERLIMRLRTRDPQGRGCDQRVVTLTYDPERDSYMIDVEGHFTVTGGPLATNAVIEYTDPYWINLPGPAFDFPGQGRKRWDMFVYEDVDGNIYQITHNHTQSTHMDIHLPRGGRVALVYEPDGNPVIELPDETADHTHLELCAWGYDLHFMWEVATRGTEVVLSEGTELPIHYRVYQLTPAEAQEMMARSQPRPLTPREKLFGRNLPVLLKRSTFDRLLGPHDSTASGAIDPWFWQPLEDDSAVVPEGENCVWDNQIGRTDHYSVRVQRAEPGLSSWRTHVLGPSFWGPPWPDTDHYEVIGYLKTENVEGKGAYIAAQFSGNSAELDESRTIFESEKLTGTNDWTEVRCLIPQRASGNRLNIQLRLEGTGKAWFDDVTWPPYGD